MKIAAGLMIALSLIVLVEDQAEAGRIGFELKRDGIRVGYDYDQYSSRPHYLYPGESHIKISLGNDNVGCSLRVGTKSSNTSLLKLSGPLAVRNVTNLGSFLEEMSRTIKAPLDPRYWRFPFSCLTTGTITVSNPPTVSVPVMLILTYGPFLTKTAPVLVTQKIGIKSVSATPVRRTYSLGQPLALTVNFTRKTLDEENPQRLAVKWRVTKGKLCIGSYSSLTTNK